MKIKKYIKDFYDFFGDDAIKPDEPAYDPVHVAAMIVLVLVGMAVLFWLLWALMVCEGGVFIKIIPFIQVVFTKKTLQDFGYEGYPYELGIFEGWIVNLSALIILIGLIIGIHTIFKKLEKSSAHDRSAKE